MVALVPFLLALGIVALGALVWRHAYTLTLYGEQIDAIGSTTPIEEVEPTDWNVTLTKASAGIFFLMGGLLLLGALLA